MAASVVKLCTDANNGRSRQGCFGSVKFDAYPVSSV